MKLTYKSTDGNVTEIEVNSAVAELLAEFAREDKNAARKERWRKEVSIEALNELTGFETTDTSIDIELDYIAKEEQIILHNALSQLSDKQGRLIQLFYNEEKTECEIAVLFGVSQQAVSQQLVTIKKALQKYFEKYL